MKSLILFTAVLALSYAAIIKECDPNTEANGCDSDECCIEESEFFKVSKRDAVGTLEGFPKVFPFGRPGRCVKYWKEGENCYSMASWQTCGCAAGLKCHYTPHPDELKRAIPPQYRPKGVHACISDASPV